MRSRSDRRRNLRALGPVLVSAITATLVLALAAGAWAAHDDDTALASRASAILG